MYRTRSAFIVLGVIAMCVLSALASNPTKPLVTSAGATMVVVNSQVVMWLQASSNGYSPQERWAIVENRIIRASQVAQPVSWSMVNGAPTIFVGDRCIVTVCQGDAKVNGCTPSVLAGVWTDNLHRALDSMYR